MDISAEYDSMNPDHALLSTNKTFEATPITDFYSGKTVFITGGTGFLGTKSTRHPDVRMAGGPNFEDSSFSGEVLLGKLVTTCSVKRVYVLMKAKDGKCIQQRLAEFIQSPVFDEVKINNAGALDKIVPISGNIRERQLGMTEEDIAMLCSEVQVVFHSAASINMDSEINDAIEINTKATAELVKLGQRMRQLRVFLYVSTAYSNCQRTLIDERVYEPSTSIEAIYSIFEDLKNGEILISPRNYLMENRPNSYTFSKSLAENIVQEGLKGIPSVIIRPSIILSSLKYPEPGWTSSWSAPNRLLLAISEGYLRCYSGDADCTLDVVPVDQVANLIIASVWDADKHQNETVKVFNCCTSLRNPVSVGRYLRSGVHCARKYSWSALFTRFLIIVKNHVLFKILWFFLQTIPAYVLDTLSSLMLGKPRMTKANASLIRAKTVSSYFVFNEITFIDHNTRKLVKHMHPRDQALFDFNFGAIDWDKYLETNVLGLQRYLMRK